MFGKKTILGAILILLMAGIIYLPATQGDFVWDDDRFLTDNPMIQSQDGLYQFWSTRQAPDYFPLTSTMLWLEWRLWGKNPMGYHVVNVMLHALSAILLWRILFMLRIPGAWLAALVFAIHPVNVESVAWITERKNALSMLFYLFSVLFYLKFLNRKQVWSYGASLGTFLLALLSKTAVVMQPFVLLGCAWWQNKTLSKKDLFHSLPFFALSLVFGLITIWFQSVGTEAAMVRTDPFLSRLAGAGWAVWFYLSKVFAPCNLCFVYPRWEVDTASPWAHVPALMVLVVLLLFWRHRNGWGRPFFFSFAYYVIMLLPVLGFLDIYYMRYSLVADHWQYFSMVGIVALVCGMGVYLFGKVGRHMKPALMCAAILVVSVLCFQSWKQCHIYRNVEALWRDTLEKNPQAWMAHDNLGVYLGKKGKINEALFHLAEAVRINPKNEKAHNNLGIALVRAGRIAEGISHYEEALRLKPGYLAAQHNLKIAHEKRRRSRQRE